MAFSNDEIRAIYILDIFEPKRRTNYSGGNAPSQVNHDGIHRASGVRTQPPSLLYAFEPRNALRSSNLQAATKHHDLA
jgi:hypothetical protein